MKQEGNTKRALAVGIGCFLLAAAGLGMTGAKSQYVDAIRMDLGYSTSFMTGMVSLSTLSMAVTCLFFAPLHRLLKTIRRIVFTGMIAICLGYVIPAVLHSPAALVIGYLLQGFGLACLADVPISTLVNNWFTNNPGTVLGLCFMGSGIGGVVFNPVTGLLIKNVGWSGSYLVTAAVTIVLVLPVLILGRDRPADAETGAPEGAPVVKKKDEGEKLSILEALRLPGFIPFLLVTLLAGLCIPAVQHNSSPILNAAGIDPTVTAFIMSVIYASLSVGKVVMGICNDRLGARVTISIQTGAYVLAVLVLIVMTVFVHSVALGVVFAVIFGFSYTWQSLAQPSALRVLIDKKYFSSCLGITVAMLHFGSAFSVTVAGIVKDAVGSYTPVLIVYAAAVSAAFAFYQILFSRRAKAVAGT